MNGNSYKGVKADYSLMLHFRLLFLCSVFLGFSSVPLNADTRVDGFFRENLLDEGFFESNEAIQAEKQNSSKPESFFISREERRRNPDKAPSNSIKVERQPPLIVRRRVYYPYQMGTPFWRGNLWGQLPQGQTGPGQNSPQNNPLGTQPPVGSPVPTQTPIFP